MKTEQSGIVLVRKVLRYTPHHRQRLLETVIDTRSQEHVEHVEITFG